MRLTYDDQADAAYLYLMDPIGPGQANLQVALIDTPNGQSQVTLDFDANGFLLGIEILAASQALLPEVLERATRL